MCPQCMQLSARARYPAASGNSATVPAQHSGRPGPLEPSWSVGSSKRRDPHNTEKAKRNQRCLHLGSS
eukprot:1702555-Pyramimonas_sp.AAC.1